MKNPPKRTIRPYAPGSERINTCPGTFTPGLVPWTSPPLKTNKPPFTGVILLKFDFDISFNISTKHFIAWRHQWRRQPVLAWTCPDIDLCFRANHSGLIISSYSLNVKNLFTHA
ncbi:MAG: hypothetical protein A2Z02_03270 [Chloroflexi bacterium RBG_16_48_7]|nr:MAG: hypothetical protein A2Z02_03270 [Chloroflexi bacterium RBG_16_48_7]